MICTLCKQHALEYGYLCPECALTTINRLTLLPRMWASLEPWLTPGTSGTAQYGGRVRRAEAPLPLDTEVLDLRSAGGIAGVLEDWRDAVWETRSRPVPARSGALANRIRTAAAQLVGEIYFIALWEQGGSLAHEIRRLVDRVRAVVDQGDRDPQQHTFLGYCIAVDPSGIVCGRRLVADMARTVQCDWCLCQYPPDTWLTLRRYQPGSLRPTQVDSAGEHEEGLEPAA
ncbi:hypothetical protein [Streptomyces sp. NBC_00582]|uniref:hypothetical protein n=1 Tax=Streptomyces sp. NBC_00582 TaxID=2975783 RepID=UPI002E80C9C3|nr:hypothetical protein [Streptomyces sp. NBC_00582]WUB64458.1 hypothetical protein OG852_30720 [Streptomyces sp. NBC_00582]